MANKNDSRRLDELVKQTLNNYEAQEVTPDWTKMESLLGSAPKSVSSNFQMPSISIEGAGLLKRVFSSYVFITVLMLAGGGYLLYTILKAPKPDTSVVTALPPVDSTLNKPVVAPVVVSTPVVTPVEVKKEAAKDTVAIVKPEETKEAKEEKARIEKEKEEAELAEKTKLEKAETEKLKADKKREEKKEEAKRAEKKEKEKKERALKAEKEKKEKEKKEAPKETLKKTNNPIGLSNFFRSVNVDSLKKQQSQEQQQQQPKDSVKTQ